MSRTIVVHVRKAPFKQGHPDCVYIGRDCAEFTDEGWNNPFHIGRDGDRVEVLRRYREWLSGNEYLLKRRSEGKCWAAGVSPKPATAMYLRSL
jgi:hypothetical protein